MRKLLIGLVIVVVLVAGVAFVAVSNLNGYLEQNRDRLKALASDAAGREVSYERAEVAFSGGLAVRLVGLTVSEDPAFGQPDFLSLEDAFVGIRLLPALQKKIEVSGIALSEPTIRVIQTSRGFNFSTLGGGDTGAEETSPPSDPDAEDATPFAVAIAALEISKGTIIFEDRTSEDGLSLVLDELETSGTDLALDGPIALDLSARARSQKPADAGLESRLVAAIVIESLDTLAGTVHLESPTFRPAIFGVRLEEGDAAERIEALEVDVVLPEDVPKTGYAVEIRSGAARLSGIDLDRMAIDLNYRDPGSGGAPAVRLDRVDIGLAGGNLGLTGDVVLGEPGQSPFDLDLVIRELDSGALATAFLDAPANSVTGPLGGDIELTGRSLEWESLKKSLAGNIRLGVGDGALENTNVLNELVGQLVADPGLGALVANTIREVAPSELDGNRTDFSGIDVALQVANGAVQAKNLSMDAGDFELRAAGQMTLDGDLSADGRLRLSEGLSAKILKKADRLGAALSDDGIVEIPVRIGGTAGSPDILPDLSILAERAKDTIAKEVGDRAAKELSERLFGKDADGEGKSVEDAARDALREGLGGFLGR